MTATRVTIVTRARRCDPGQRHELRFVDATPIRDGRLQLFQQPLLLPERGSGRAAECVHLEQAQRRAHRVGPEHLECRVDGAGGAHTEGERGEQLRDVGVEQRVVNGDVTEAEVNEPGRARGSTTTFAAIQIAVGDAMGVQDRELPPDRVEQRVVDRVAVVDLVKRVTVDQVVGDQHRIGADFGECTHARGAHAHVTRLERCQGLMLDVAPQRPERTLVADVLQAQRAGRGDSTSAERSSGLSTLHSNRVRSNRVAM